MTRVIKNRILPILLLVIASYAMGQMVPGTRVVRFKLPLFNESGHRIWYLRGEEGTYMSETQVKIDGMTVSQYTGDENDQRIALLTSPEAIFHFDSVTAYGPGELKVSTDNFEITGNDWIWVGDKKEITFHDGIKVVLFEEIGNILK